MVETLTKQKKDLFIKDIVPKLDNPFKKQDKKEIPLTPYDKALWMGKELIEKPLKGGGTSRIIVQHHKNRMTVFERIQVLTKEYPTYLYQNWGKHLDGASIITAIINIDGRDVAIYGHDFTNRAGSMDATNGEKLARLIYLAGEKGIPLIGMNDSAGAYVPAGVGGLDGYSEAFCALRKISGVVPSIMLMFGFNAGRWFLSTATRFFYDSASGYIFWVNRSTSCKRGIRRRYYSG
jgi:acetyl-CoA carboxylase carboxyltransferase component